jgi:hypothetical protein
VCHTADLLQDDSLLDLCDIRFSRKKCKVLSRFLLRHDGPICQLSDLFFLVAFAARCHDSAEANGLRECRYGRAGGVRAQSFQNDQNLAHYHWSLRFRFFVYVPIYNDNVVN